MVGNDTALERVDLRCLTCRGLQVLEYLNAREHLLDGVGAEEIKIDAVEFVGVPTLIPFGPLFGIADGAHAAQVHSRSDVGTVVFLYQIRERLVRGVRVLVVAAQDEGKCSYLGGP